MTAQGGNFGEEAHDEAKRPPQTPEARPVPPDFVPPAYGGQSPAQPGPNAPHRPPPGPVPPWSSPSSGNPPPAYPPPAGYGPSGYHDSPAYGSPSYPPSPPQYGQPYPAPGYGGGYSQQSDFGYGGPAGYPGYYDPYSPYQARPNETNGMAIGSLVTSITGLLLGAPLTMFCYVGILVPIVGFVLGIVALHQIKRTHQQGRGLAIAGIAVGAVATVLLVVLLIAVMAALTSRSIPPAFR